MCFKTFLGDDGALAFFNFSTLTRRTLQKKPVVYVNKICEKPFMSPLPVIHLGDHGSDDVITTLMLLGRPDLFDLRGVIATRGNVGARQCAKNAALTVALANRRDVPVFVGAEAPLAGPDLAGDDAFGHDGLGGARFDGIEPVPVQENGTGWLIETLRRAPSPVTLIVTSPLTTLANALQQDPGIESRIGRIVMMGGALDPQGPHARTGNITPLAEFNFYMDPHAADDVLARGLPIDIYPLDATQALFFTPTRQAIVRDRIRKPWTAALMTMMSAAEPLDRMKFGVDGAFVHDQHVVTGMMDPSLYSGERLGLRVEKSDPQSPDYGRLLRDPSRHPHMVMRRVHDPDRVFDMMIDCLESV